MANGPIDRDLHAKLAEALFGEVTSDTRSRAKEINYMRAFYGGEIAVGLKAGQYPAPSVPFQRTPTGRKPSEPEMQHLNHSIQGKRASFVCVDDLDYSALELRVLARFPPEKEALLREALRNHWETFTWEAIYGKAPDHS